MTAFSTYDIQVIEATKNDFLVVKNMASFYIYDLSRYCGIGSINWAIPNNGHYECYDFKNFFNNNLYRVFLLKINQELGGFVIIKQDHENTFYIIEEFFITARFQGQGIGQHIAHKIWQLYPGNWEISVIPENVKALNFWQKCITNFIQNNFEQTTRTVDFDMYQPTRIVFSFYNKVKI